MVSSGGGVRDRDAALEKDYIEASREGLGDTSIFGEAFKQALGSVDERRSLYRDLANDMLNKVPLSEMEILTLSYGMRFDEPSARPVELDSLIPQLARQEAMSPGSTQVENIASQVEKEEMFNTVEQIFPFLPGRGMFSRGGGAATPKGPGMLSGLGSHLKAHPWRAAASLAGGASVIGYSLNPGGAESIYGAPIDGALEEATSTGEISTDEVEDLTDEEFESLQNLVERREVMVIDASTGQAVILNTQDQDKLVGSSGTGSTPSGQYSPGLVAMAEAYGISPEEMSQIANAANDQTFGTINPQMFGEIKVPFNSFPYGVDISTGEAYQQPPLASDTPVPSGLAGRLPADDLAAGFPTAPTVVPPGGQLNPKSFTQYGDQTLLQIVSDTADMYDVPVELLYGLINAESGFTANALSPDGMRAGLAQIDLDLYSHISVEQALNPLFAIRWAGRELRMNANKFNGFEGAVASQFDMAEAEFLAKTGQFKSPYAKAFVSDVFTYAGSSGMGKYMLDPSQLPSVASQSRGGGGGGGGIKVPPYQAPDPAALREIIRQTYEQYLERSPNDDDTASSLKNLDESYRGKYNAAVAKLQGKASTDVDPQARYEEYIRGLGEFAYREESRDTRDAMSFMGDIVRIMQGV